MDGRGIGAGVHGKGAAEFFGGFYAGEAQPDTETPSFGPVVQFEIDHQPVTGKDGAGHDVGDIEALQVVAGEHESHEHQAEQDKCKGIRHVVSVIDRSGKHGDEYEHQHVTGTGGAGV